MEHHLHHKVTRIHSKRLPTRNNRNRCNRMPNSRYHPMLSLLSNKYHFIRNNSSHKIKALSPKRLEL